MCRTKDVLVLKRCNSSRKCKIKPKLVWHVLDANDMIVSDFLIDVEMD